MIRKTVAYFIEIIIVSFFSYVPIFAENFYIENYDIDINVNELKQANITEKLDVFFTHDSHGIYRKIPHDKAKITNIHVSEQNTIREDGQTTNIKIGNPNRLIIGKHTYEISYVYKYFDNKNEFYHNIIGTDWDTEIRHVNFNVTMPKEFNPADVGLSIGNYGIRGFEGGAIFRIDGLNISGQVNRILNPKEGVTIRLEVPKDYFHKVTEKNTITYFCIILLCFVTFISFIIWYKFGKDEKTIPVVNFYPPEKMNTLEVEIAYKESASMQGLIAMLFSLAQKGYITISEQNGDFTLEKIKDYEEKDSLERSYMKALFSSKTLFSSKETEDNIVTKDDLKYSQIFYKKCEAILNNANLRQEKLYEKKSVSWGLRAIMAICLLITFSITFFAFINFNFYEVEKVSIILIFIIAVAIFILIFSRNKNFIVLISALLLLFMPFFFFLNAFNMIELNNKPIFLTGIPCIIICSICLYHLRKFNKKTLMTLGNLLGFKKFIEVAESSRLKTLVEQDPQYFYNILPYAYLFGVSDKWIKKFENIIPLEPSWYYGRSFNHTSFRHISNSMKSVSVPSVANGGVSSKSGGGGGFSGGGGGGGGGGSW